eukprot:322215-Prymnesium_polylepis.1
MKLIVPPVHAGARQCGQRELANVRADRWELSLRAGGANRDGSDAIHGEDRGRPSADECLYM